MRKRVPAGGEMVCAEMGTGSCSPAKAGSGDDQSIDNPGVVITFESRSKVR